MILADKFNVYKEDQKISKSQIDNYFENLILLDQKVYSSNLIHSYLLDNVDKNININENIRDDILKIVTNHILSYLRQVIREWRKMKNKLDLDFIHDFSYKFISKLKKIGIPFGLLKDNKLFDSKLEINNKKYKLWGVSEILNIGIKLFCNKIISSQLVSLVLIDSITENNNFKNLINFSNLMNKLNLYYQSNMEWYTNLIKDTFYDKMPINEYPYLKKLEINRSFKDIYIFSDISNYYLDCERKSKILKLDSITSCEKIFKKLTNILENNIRNFIKYKKNELLVSFIDSNKNIITKLFINDNNTLIEILSYFDNFIIESNNIDLLLNFYCILNSIIKNEKKLKDYYYILEEKILIILNKENYNILFNEYIYNLIIEFKVLKKLKNYDLKIIKLCSNFTLLIKLVNKINNKDKFIKNYSKNLILRLTNDLDYETEEQFYSIMNEVLNIKYINKIKKIIYDIKISNKINNDFYEFNDSFSQKKEYNILTTSYGNWDISINEGNYKNNYFEINELDQIIEDNFKQYLISYDYFYKQKYSSKRNLVWYPHLGKMNIDIEIKENFNLNIDLLPIQYQLLMFIINKSKDYLNIDQFYNKIQNITSYNLDFIKNLVGSLIRSNLVNIVNIKIGDDVLDGKTLELNYKYNDKKYINLIDIFYTLSNINVKWEIKRNQELVHERKTILMTVINSLLKYDINKNGIKQKDLLIEIKKKISLFEVNETLLIYTLQKMIGKNYIKLDQGKWSKLIY
jgi:hypothetical protein